MTYHCDDDGIVVCPEVSMAKPNTHAHTYGQGPDYPEGNARYCNGMHLVGIN